MSNTPPPSLRYSDIPSVLDFIEREIAKGSGPTCFRIHAAELAKLVPLFEADARWFPEQHPLNKIARQKITAFQTTKQMFLDAAEKLEAEAAQQGGVTNGSSGFTAPR